MHQQKNDQDALTIKLLLDKGNVLIMTHNPGSSVQIISTRLIAGIVSHLGGDINLNWNTHTKKLNDASTSVLKDL